MVSVSALWCPLTTPTVLLGFLSPWTWGISSQLLQQSAATAPYLGWGVSSHGRPSWPWTWSSSSWPAVPDLGRGEDPLHRSCTVAAWRSWLPPLTLGRGSSSRPRFCVVRCSWRASASVLLPAPLQLKNVCPFFLLEYSRPPSPWGPLDFLPRKWLSVTAPCHKGNHHGDLQERACLWPVLFLCTNGITHVFPYVSSLPHSTPKLQSSTTFCN